MEIWEKDLSSSLDVLYLSYLLGIQKDFKEAFGYTNLNSKEKRKKKKELKGEAKPEDLNVGYTRW